MPAVTIGNTPLRECSRCEGVWADTASLEQICADREKQAAVLGVAVALPTDLTGSVEKNIRYVPCPVCNRLMHRVNFARCSHVVVDVCKPHGTWFDRDELRRIVEFIRSGGLDKARTLEIARWDQERRKLAAAKTAAAWDTTSREGGTRYDDLPIGVSVAAEFLASMLD